MNIPKKQFNRDLAQTLKDKAYRSIEIINMLQESHEDTEIMDKLGCERALVYYYITKLTNKKG